MLSQPNKLRSNRSRFYLMIILITASPLYMYAQDNLLLKYYDSMWRPAPKETAYFMTEFLKEDTLYRCTSYWIKSGKLNCKSSFSDTLFTKPVGKLRRYYENGKMEDSIIYEGWRVKSINHYYDNGKLWIRYIKDYVNNNDTTEGFDIDGNKIDDFVYSKLPEYRGGQVQWVKYLSANIRSKVAVKNGARIGTHQVIVSYVVDTDGHIRDIKPETNLGYGMEEEVIRVLKNAPKWIPGIIMNKKTSITLRQPVTFLVEWK